MFGIYGINIKIYTINIIFIVCYFNNTNHKYELIANGSILDSLPIWSKVRSLVDEYGKHIVEDVNPLNGS